jgi:uncharacterized caspase-like protein
LLFISQQATADFYGLVIGVDQYHNYNSLDGAVNDAKVIADSLNLIGSKETKLLLDDGATRSEIKKSWDDISSKAKAGDTVFFTYAGHGAQQPERVKGTEADGQDEFYVLANFAESGKNTAERIIDDDLQEWFSKRPDLNIVLVSDSCHSGTMTRAYKSSKVKYRKANVRTIKNDALPVSNNADIIDERKTKLPHVIAFSGVQDSEEVPETSIENQQHGALSWYFAKGLLGDADTNKDGIVAVSELTNYLVEKVRMQTEGIQHPQITFAKDMEISKSNVTQNALPALDFSVSNNSADLPLVKTVLNGVKNIRISNLQKGELDWDVNNQTIKDSTGKIVYSFPVENLQSGTTKAYKRKAEVTEITFNPEEVIKAIQPVIDNLLITKQEGILKPIAFSIKSQSDAKVFSEKLSGIKLSALGQELLEWDVDSNVIKNQFHDVVYMIPSIQSTETRAYRRQDTDKKAIAIAPETLKSVQEIIDKFRLVEELKKISDGSLEVKLLPNDKLHIKGETVSFEINRQKYPNFTLINLTVDGKINFLYPLLQKDSITIDTNKAYKLSDLEVTEPFGADHLIAIFSDKPLISLHQALKKSEGVGSLNEFSNLLKSELKKVNYQLGIHASFTASSL